MNYVFIGDGRLARHLGHYLSAEGHRVSIWSRRSSKDPETLFEKADVICLSTRDREIQAVIEAYKLTNFAKPLVHFSGSQSIDHAFGFHPLMSFGKNLYEQKTYQNMAFVGANKAPEFKSCFPKLKNKYYQIEASKLALYHTYCSMAGNFPQILWNEISKNFQSELNLDPQILNNYILQISKNFSEQGSEALTGPLVRNDSRTLVRHLDALSSSRLQNIYYSFINFFQKTNSTGSSHESSGISSNQI